MPPSYYKIKLTADVALVLSEWLEQSEDRGWEGVPVAHPGELVALSQLGGALETTLPELFSRHYSDLVSDARARLAAAYTPEEE